MARARLLRTDRDALKAQLYRFQNFMQTFDSSKMPELLIRVGKIESIIDSFNEIQLELERLETTNNADEHEQERSNFENAYYSVVGRAKEHLRVAINNTPVSETSTTVRAKIKLPQLNLPTYNGEYQNWISFRDNFTAIIHNNTALSDVEKLRYLRGQLTGAAALVIHGVQITDANYAVAWDLLCKRFENKRFCVENYVRSIFELKPIPKSNHKDLRSLLDTLVVSLRGLKALSVKTDSWDPLLIYILTTKLDTVTFKEWRECKLASDLPTLDEFKEFLDKRCNLLESLQNNKITDGQLPTRAAPTHDVNRTKAVSYASTSERCPLCNVSHSIYRCQRFLEQPVKGRWDTANNLLLCTNCLRAGHKAPKCKSRGCYKCSRKHHTLLHTDTNVVNTAAAAVPKTHNTNDQTTPTVSATSCDTNDTQEVLLSTALVYAVIKHHQRKPIRVLLDSASQSSYITESACNNLGLCKIPTHSTVSGIAGNIEHVKYYVNVTVRSKHNAYEQTIRCLVLPRITNNIPAVSFNPDLINIPINMPLADETFYESGDIDVLMGAQHFWDILCDGKIQLAKNGPTLQNTHFGWILAGLLHIPNNDRPKHTMAHCALNDEVAKFWQIEEFAEPVLSDEQKMCEDIFSTTTRREEDGRFIVKLPLRENATQLGDSRRSALNRFHLLESKLQRNDELREAYTRFMDEYENLGHMTVVDENEADSLPSSVFYLPHHGVTKETSLTTKHRTVFDGSAKSDSGLSLNDVLYVGPTLQDDIFSIVIRFRKYTYAMTADIEQMFRQIRVCDEHKHLQRIFWRSDPSDEIKCYTLNTVTYGLSCSPFLSTRCLKQLAVENERINPIASAAIAENMYVDDLLGGADDIGDAIKLRDDVTDILCSGQFNLRKWVANDTRIIPANEAGDTLKAVVLGENDTNKTLGILWNPAHDTFQYRAESNFIRSKITKRVILSEISRIYDILGMLAPIITVAKLIMQSLWVDKLPWDEPVSTKLHDAWTNFRNDLQNISNLKIPRHILCRKASNIQLHIFCDSSERAYGACVYVRSVSTEGEIVLRLVCAKSRVAPLRKLTIPRLELLGALLGAKLAKRVTTALQLKIDNYYYWSDSTIVLSWIKSDAARWKTFVANRVSTIQTLTNTNDWYHIDTHNNPADVLSRGCTATELQSNKSWWIGPSFLSQSEGSWPSTSEPTVLKLPHDCPEMKVSAVTLTVTQNDMSIFERFSSLNKLLRVVTYCKRFIQICRNCVSNKKSSKFTNALTHNEVHETLVNLIKLAQTQTLSNEIAQLSKQQSLRTNNKLSSLCPFIDKNGLLRVGGRLENSQLNQDAKHQILLPAKHPLTTLIAQHFHITNLHCGPHALLGHIRQKYWPIQGRNLTKKIVHDCIVCFRARPRSYQYKMGELPKERLNPAPAFYNCGVDFAGPFLIKDKRTRGCKLVKSYLCIFVCLATKAMHLELVGDLSSEAFLACLRRFVARRGSPASITSDNATNFIGANRQLTEFIKLINRAELQNFLLEGRITWKFIPPRSPNFGGLWEAGVKAVKAHLIKVTKSVSLDYESFYTVLTQIEAVLNSRPLTPLSPDPTDLNPLTPGHFIIGRPITSVVDQDVVDVPTGRLPNFQRAQQVIQHFWKRWQKEYLAQLQNRWKWKDGRGAPPAIGALVILKEDYAPPCLWRLGRITAHHPGTDGIVRVVSVRTVSGEVKRALTKICVLPECDTKYSLNCETNSQVFDS